MAQQQETGINKDLRLILRTLADTLSQEDATKVFNGASALVSLFLRNQCGTE